MKRLIFIAVCTTLIITTSKAQTAEEIINTYLEKTGGLDNWKKLTGIKTYSKINSQGREIPYQTIRLKNGKMLTKSEMQGKEIIQQAFDGNASWGHNSMTMKAEKNDNETTENIKRETGDFPNPFVDYASKGYSLELLGNEIVEGTLCYKIKLTKKPLLIDGKEEENVVFYYFDIENVVPIVIETKVKSGSSKGMIYQTSLSDYQEVNGLFFAFSSTRKAKGRAEGQTVNITRIEFDPQIDESIFKFVESEE